MAGGDATWTFCHFGLLVTGKGEQNFLPLLFRELMTSRRCHFEVIARIGQRHPITSQKKILKMTGTNKIIPDKDSQEIGLPACNHLNKQRKPHERAFVILLDDLEHDRVSQASQVFDRYRKALDTRLGERKHLAAVHFLVNMLEAYYFADAAAINAVLGTELTDSLDDVEEIRHPKKDLKKKKASFDEVKDGKKIIEHLDVSHVLSRPDTCASLRALFGWCAKALGEEPTDRFCLTSGVYSVVTGAQIGEL